MKKLVRHEDIFGMARIGWVPEGSMRSVEVYVHTDDPGKVPHFHVRKYSGSNNFEWETCIRFDSSEYFLHGSYSDKLPSRKVAKQLDAMLRSKDKSNRYGATYWETAVDEWNRNNSDVMLPLDLEQPDYSKL